MNEIEIEYKNVKSILEIDEMKEYEFKYGSEKSKKEIRIKAKCLEYINDGKEFYYQIFVKLPFSVKSSWKKTKPDDLSNEVCKLIESKLNSKYKDIQIRNYNNFKQLEKFISEVGEYNKGFYSSKFNHGYLFEQINEKSINEISKEIYEIEKIKSFSQIPENHEFKLTWKQFVKMLIIDNCYYCGISISLINEISEKDKLFTKRARGYSLEIDQKDAYSGYEDDNCVASCYWCNNAKTDEFSESEFKNIAYGINIAWNERLKQINSTFQISFPEKVQK